MLKKKSEEETAADWVFIKKRGRGCVAALIIPPAILLALVCYSKGVFDGQANCTIFQSQCPEIISKESSK